jgi:hypothetical protein
MDASMVTKNQIKGTAEAAGAPLPTVSMKNTRFLEYFPIKYEKNEVNL